MRRGRTGEAEISDFDSAVIGEQHVLGFQIAVDNAVAMRRGKAGQHGFHDVERLLRREDRMLAEQFAQRDSRKVLHDEIGGIRILALIVDIDDVGMREPCG